MIFLNAEQHISANFLCRFVVILFITEMKLCCFFWNILAYICYLSSINCALYINKGLPVAHTVKSLPIMPEAWVESLGQ